MKYLKGILGIAILCLLIGPYVWPFWTGDLFYSGGKVIPSARVKVPPYYELSGQWLNSQAGDYNIISVPLGIFDGSVLRWDNGSSGYFSINPDIWLYNHPVIAQEGEASGIPGVAFSSLFSNYDFEAGTLDGWMSSYPQFVSINSSSSHTGSHSVQLSVENESSVDLFTNALLPVHTPTIYFSFFAKSSSPYAKIQPTIWYYNNISFLQADLGNQTSATEAWTEYRMDAVVPSRALFYRLGVVATASTASNTIVNVDDFQFSDMVDVYNLGRVLTVLNVRYVVFHNDTNWQYVQGHPWWITTAPKVMLDKISVQAGISRAQQFGELYLFVNSEWSEFHVYATSEFVRVQSLGEMLSRIQAINLTSSISPVFLSASQNNDQALVIPSGSNLSYSPSSSYRRLDGSSFLVNVYNAANPFFLVLSEDYDPLWSASLEDGKTLQHYEGNFFANAWWVNQTGTFTIVLRYTGQTILNVGYAFTLLTAIIVGIEASYVLTKVRRPLRARPG